jgi:WD40 repeat protein
MLCVKCRNALPAPEPEAVPPPPTADVAPPLETPVALISSEEVAPQLRVLKHTPRPRSRRPLLIVLLVLAAAALLEFPLVSRTWETTTGHLLELREPGAPTAIAYRGDGSLMTVLADGTVQLRDSATGAAKRTVKGIRVSGSRAVTASANGKLVAEIPTGAAVPVRVIDVASGKGRSLAPKEPWKAVAFSRQGSLLAAAGRRVVLWEAGSGVTVRAFAAPGGGALEAVVFSPDGRLLAARNSAGVRLWEVKSGRLVRTIAAKEPSGSGDLALSPDGGILATGGESVRLWEVKSGTLLRELGPRLPGDGLVRFSPDGTLLAAGGQDRVRLWETATGKPHGRLLGGSGWVEQQVVRRGIGVTDLAFSPDGKTLASTWVETSADGKPAPVGGGMVRLWKLQ